MPIVIKYGGNAMTDGRARREVAGTIRALAEEGAQPTVVHGGGPFIARALEEAGLEHRFVRGLRVTSREAMPLVERELTLLGKRLAQEIGCALGLSGRDAGLLTAEPLAPELGRVGRMTGVRAEVLRALLEARLTPVLACLALDAEGEPLNVNGDEAAGAVAGALASPVVFLTDVPGVLDDPADPTSVLPELREAEARARIEDGRIGGGMIPKVEAALAALGRGAPSAVVADGRDAAGIAPAVRGERGTRLRP